MIYKNMMETIIHKKNSSEVVFEPRLTPTISSNYCCYTCLVVSSSIIACEGNGWLGRNTDISTEVEILILNTIDIVKI